MRATGAWYAAHRPRPCSLCCGGAPALPAPPGAAAPAGKTNGTCYYVAPTKAGKCYHTRQDCSSLRGGSVPVTDVGARRKCSLC